MSAPRSAFVGLFGFVLLVAGCGGDTATVANNSPSPAKAPATRSDAARFASTDAPTPEAPAPANPQVASNESPPGLGVESRGGGRSRPSVTILCSFYPVYLMTKNVVGETRGVAVSLMLPASKGCPHGYDLTPGDGKRIAAAGIVVVNGGGLEEFDEKKIKNFNPHVRVVDSTKGLKLLDAECCHDEEEEGEHHHHESGKNPHTFTSPFMAAQQVKAIGEGLAHADAERGDYYRKNAATYAAKLERLSKEMKDALASAKGAKVVTSHEIFQYLTADLGVVVVGEVQSGAKGDKPPRKLIEKIKKEKAKAIFTEPQYSSAKAELIAKEAGVPAYQLDPLATGPENPPADHYEKTMRANLEVLKKALGGA